MPGSVEPPRRATATVAERSRDGDPAATRRAAATFGGEYRPGSAGRAVRRFVYRYGWRAYALPLLVVVTVAALLTMHEPPGQAAGPPAAPGAQPPGTPTAVPTAAGNTLLKSDSPAGNVHPSALAPTELPDGPSYTEKGKGTFSVIAGTTKAVGHGPLHTYDVEIERGVKGIDPQQFADFVDRTLADDRSWAGTGAGPDEVSLQRVGPRQADFHITLTSAKTVQGICGYEIPVETSCYMPAGPNDDDNRVVINDARWVRGAPAYVGDLTAYRQYLINHEVGHALGHQHAHQCLPGGLAPAMMQQTIGLRDAESGKMCQANPWPYPRNAKGRVVKGAPGQEAADTPQNNEFALTGD